MSRSDHRHPLFEPKTWRLVHGGAIALALAGTSCSQTMGSDADGEAIGQSHQALLLGDVWTMEDASRWTVVQGSATKSINSAHTQGSYSLSLKASNAVALKSAAVSKPSEPLSSVLGLDVMVPSQAGPSAWGTVQLTMDSAALQIWGRYLGQVALAAPKGVWQTISFAIPPAVYNKLATSSFSDLAITLTLNPNGGNNGAFLFDNLRFLPVAGCAGQANGTACDDTVACTSGTTCGNGVCGTGEAYCDFNGAVRGFETPRAWDVSSGTASLMPSTARHEGAQALAVVAPYYTTITSIQIATEPMVGKQMGLWVQIPTSQPNPSWHGDVTLNLKAPGLSIDYSKTLPLLPYATGTWIELSFELPDSVYAAMSNTNYASLYYSITINPPNGQTGAYLLDDLHFQPVSSCAGMLKNTACEDGNACTAGATCFNGTCGTTVDCNDDNPCTTDSCDPATGCVHEANTLPCDDQNACTTQDTCSGGACVGGPAPDCDDGNGCTDDSCDVTTGCVSTDNTAPCEDGNACTTEDTCSDGACVGGPAPNCDDGNGCTDDSCDVATGCMYANNTAGCEDGNACTTADTCSDGACVGGPAPNCDDGNGCTDDSCDANSGCLHANNAGSCDDGNPCTRSDTCQAGSCQGSNPAPVGTLCDDGNSQTVNDRCIEGTCAGNPLSDDIRGYASASAGPDHNRCVPDAAHVLERMNGNGDLLAWRYRAAGCLPENDTCEFLDWGTVNYHIQGIQRLSYLEGDPALQGQYFVADLSHAAGTNYSTGPGAYLGVARMGFKGGKEGRMLGANRAFSYLTSQGARDGEPDWDVAPNPTDTFIPLPYTYPGTGQTVDTCNYRIDDETIQWQNHPSGIQAIGSHVVVPLQAWYATDSLIDLCDSWTPEWSLPYVRLYDFADPEAPVLRSTFLSAVNHERCDGHSTSNNAAAITKLDNGKFLLMLFKNGPSFEFYVSQDSNIDNPDLFKKGPDGTGSFNWCPACWAGTCLDPAGSVTVEYTDPDDVYTGNAAAGDNMNFITDCSTGQIFLMALYGSGSTGRLTLYKVNVTQEDSGTGAPSHSVEVLPNDEWPPHDKMMDCADQCNFSAAAGSYVDPDGKVIIYATQYMDDGGFDRLPLWPPTYAVYGNGTGDNPLVTWGNWTPGATPVYPAEPFFYRGVEFHERHGNAAEGTSCSQLSEGWVELYSDTGFNASTLGCQNSSCGRRMVYLDYASRNEKDTSHLGLYNFDNSASSIRWCMPEGSGLILFEESGRRVPLWGKWYQYLAGTGHVAMIEDLEDFHFQCGANCDNLWPPIMDDSISSFVFAESVPNGAIPGVPDPEN
jgi:hypothetical protein